MFWRKSNYSNFAGRVIHLFRIETFQTLLTFFPPSSCSITKFTTVSETKNRSIQLSKISNMKYTHITVDVGAAEKHYKAVWINPDEFRNVIIYPRNLLATWFHSFFSNYGKFVSNSGFEEILYQARMCSVGGIRPVFSGMSLQHVQDNSWSSCRSNIYLHL